MMGKLAVEIVQDRRQSSEHKFKDTNRHLVEVPDSFAVARWPRDADVGTIARCILGTLKHEPHVADIEVLRQALEDVVKLAGRFREGGQAMT